MIALDTNILVRFLVDDDAEQVQAARTLLESLTAERPAFICREVMIELVWVLERAYGLPRDRIAAVLEGLIATEGLEVEATNDVCSCGFRLPPRRRGLCRLDDHVCRSACRGISSLHFRQATRTS